MPLEIPTKDGRRWDLVALGEVMLRFDPGETRIHTARPFRVWEGGGEYNVARGLKRCFGLDTALVSAFADNPVGRLVQDLIYQGGVDQSHVRWVPYDGVGREVRNGLNFVERGFGIRAAVGCSDRGHTAVSQLAAGRRRLGGDLRARRRALAAHRRHLLRAVGDDAAGRARSDGRGAAARRRRVVRSQLSRIAVARVRRPRAARSRSTAAWCRWSTS